MCATRWEDLAGGSPSLVQRSEEAAPRGLMDRPDLDAPINASVGAR
ncbi:hypothetical protein [Streptomyces sp. NPDC006463]